MLAQMKLLTTLEGKNRFGWNVFCHTRDSKAKRRYLLLAMVWVMLIAMVAFYVGALSWGLTTIGLGPIVPAYLIMIASLLMLAFGLFKAAQTLFAPKGYDLLCALPIRTSSIVFSRFAQLYLSDLGLCALVMLPGCAVVGALTRPGFSFYAIGLVTTLCMPVLPLALSMLIGTGIIAAASRMKRKALAETVLTIVFVFAVLAGSFGMAAVPQESFSIAMLVSLADTIGQLIGRVYPPAAWMGTAMVDGQLGVTALYMIGNAALLALLIALTARLFHPICRRLFTHAARHDYRMGRLESKGLMKALWHREIKRYFASSVYVTNTIIGPIMGTFLAAAVLIAGTGFLETAIPLPIDLRGLIPFGLATVFTLMPPSAVSISMEGRQYWIVQSLPISRKQLLDAKLLTTLSLMAPFYALSEVLLIIALRPSFLDLVWLVAIPALLCLYAAVFGIAVNLRLPRFDWETEVYVVKQSASAALGGMISPLVAVLCAVITVLLPGHLTKLALCAALSAATYGLYGNNCKSK